MTLAAMLISSRAYRQEEECEHRVSPAAALLCADIIASSVGDSGAIAGKQQAHQLSILILHTSFEQPQHDQWTQGTSAQTASSSECQASMHASIWKTQHMQMIPRGTSRHVVTWCYAYKCVNGLL